MAPTTAYPPPLAEPEHRRQRLKVGAVCGKAARPDLCGGREVTRVPTATAVCCNALGRYWHQATDLPRVTNSVAIGGTADTPRTRRARRSDAFDPSRK